MKDNFQIITIVVFIIAAIFALLVFSGSIPIGQKADQAFGTVVVWGTFRADLVNPLLDNFNTANPTFIVRYVQKNSDLFDQELLEALASGIGPDLFFLPEDLAYHYGNKILPIAYSSFSIASFQSSFVSAGEVFLTPGGILAFPMMIDPLVMYYDRSMLDAAGIVYPPNNWNDFVDVVPMLTKKDDKNKINKNAVAFGHFSNVLHAKDILSMLFMQTGNKIVTLKDGRFISDLDTTVGVAPPASVLKFYTDFADPQKNVYSWNKSFPLSRDYFSTGNLAFYFGYASELSSLVNKNPNQNILVAEVPQIKDLGSKTTMSKVTGLAISAFSKNQNTAFIAANLLMSGGFAAQLAQNLGVVPARRDLLAQKPTDAYSPIFYRSALYGRSWLDPSPKISDGIFDKMINVVLSNSAQPIDALSEASSKLYLLLNK